MSEKKTFEESMNRLEEIVALLEGNTLPLDQTITIFEEGLNLVKECNATLGQFEKKIEEISDHHDEEDAEF